MKKNWKNWILTLVVGSAIVAIACSSKETPIQSEAPGQPIATESSRDAGDAQTASAPAISKPMVITGTVEQTNTGIIIATNVFDYHVAGKDLTSMIGKMVQATGAVEETQDIFTITVMSVTEIESQQ